MFPSGVPSEEREKKSKEGVVQGWGEIRQGRSKGVAQRYESLGNILFP